MKRITGNVGIGWRLTVAVVISLLPGATDCSADLEEIPAQVGSSTTELVPPQLTQNSMGEWNQCLEALVHPRGVRLDSYLKYIVQTSGSNVNRDEFIRTAYAVMYVETRFNHKAVSNRDAYGLMQLTSEAVQDAAQFCHLPVVEMNSLLIPSTNVKYGTCYLNKLLTEFDGDWEKTLIVYNGGYYQLTRYLEGRTMTNETANYVLQIHRVLRVCSSTIGE